MGMVKCIECEEAVNAVLNLVPKVDDDGYCWVIRGDAARAIDSIPAADVRPVARGKWTMNSDFPDRLICSECGAQFDVWHWEAKQMHFCPNCGADMREES